MSIDFYASVSGINAFFKKMGLTRKSLKEQYNKLTGK